MGCDSKIVCSLTPFPIISIHAARMGCDKIYSTNDIGEIIFQSTQPEWAATFMYSLTLPFCIDFNPRSPNGLRQRKEKAKKYWEIFQSTQPEWAATAEIAKLVVADKISIHAARMGCD